MVWDLQASSSNFSPEDTEPSSVAKVKGFNRQAVERLYIMLEEELKKHKIASEIVFKQITPTVVNIRLREVVVAVWQILSLFFKYF